MAAEVKSERKVDVLITVRLANVTPEEARALEDEIRGTADNTYGAIVSTTTNPAR